MTKAQIGKRLRRIRGKRSLREASEAAGITRGQLLAIERARTHYTVDVLIRYAESLGAKLAIE